MEQVVNKLVNLYLANVWHHDDMSKITLSRQLPFFDQFVTWFLEDNCIRILIQHAGTVDLLEF